jgi:hypothetical protein
MHHGRRKITGDEVKPSPDMAHSYAYLFKSYSYLHVRLSSHYVDRIFRRAPIEFCSYKQGSTRHEVRRQIQSSAY